MVQRLNRIVVGILRRGDQVLLVQQQGKDDPVPTWAFPGGMVEDGETLAEALQREIREETGLRVSRLGRLAYLTQIDNPLEDTQSFAFVFEVAEWSGDLQNNDPDQVILNTEFLTVRESIERLEKLPWIAMRAPAVAYLTGEAPPGTVWHYRLGPGEVEQRIDLL